MTITSQIREGAARWHANYGITPDCVYIGKKQAAEIHAMVEEIRKLGLLVSTQPTINRSVIDGMQIYEVDADSHLGFGMYPMSPCS